MMSYISRRFITILVISTLFIALSIVYSTSSDSLDFGYYLRKIRSDAFEFSVRHHLDDEQCSFPEFHSRSPEIDALIGTAPKAVNCPQVQPFLTYVSPEGSIILNQTELQAINDTSLLCSYAYFDRGSTDRDVVFEKETAFNPYENPSIKIEKPFIQISCFKSQNALFYRNVHSFPVLPHSKKILPNDKKINLLIFVLESTSRAMFHRSLPMTLDYLNNELESLEFTKFSKVGENTFPNLVPLFTGLRARNEEHWSKNMTPEIKNDKSGFYDHLPFIWKSFGNAGYVTSFVEDMSQIGTFQYSGKGFKVKPVDLWHFPFWERTRQVTLPGKSGHFCFGNQPIHKTFLELVQNFCLSMTKQAIPFFSFNIFSELSHDFSNDLSRMDRDLTTFLKKLRNSLNNTIFLLMGDHGPRFNDLRPTFQGYVEERYPVLFVTLPRWFREKYPRMEYSLKSNADTMVTVYDLHTTFLDIVNEAQGLESNSSSITRGVSLFQRTSKQRTCRQAGVPVYYCLCKPFTQLDSSSAIVISSIDPIISFLRNLTAKVRDDCLEYNFFKTLYAIKFDSVFDLDRSKEIYTIAFETIPMSKFEAFFLYDPARRSIFKESMRINPVDSNSIRGHCKFKSHQTIDAKFCFCRNKIR